MIRGRAPSRQHRVPDPYLSDALARGSSVVIFEWGLDGAEPAEEPTVKERSLTDGEDGAASLSDRSPGFGSPYARVNRIVDITLKILRWIAEFLADGTDFRLMAGSSAVGRVSGGGPLCERCRQRRPGRRIRCLQCSKRVGSGCPPDCLLRETRTLSRGRVGLCADWPMRGEGHDHRVETGRAMLRVPAPTRDTTSLREKTVQSDFQTPAAPFSPLSRIFPPRL